MKRSASLLLVVCLLLCTCMTGAQAAENKVYALTMGVHKYAANHTVTDGSSIGKVTYLRHKDGSTGSVNRIYDIEPGEKFTLTTELNPDQKGFYTFVCWLDIDSAIVSSDPVLEVTMDSSKAYFAAYAENASRHLVTYKVTDGEGSVSIASDRGIYTGVGCASVLHGASATVKISPAKEYSAYALVVGGKRVSMLGYTARSLAHAAKSADFKGVFQAILNCVKYLIGLDATYTIPSVTEDILVEISFFKPYLLRTKK